MMSGIKQTRMRRAASLVAACTVMAALVVLTAGAVLAAPGRNNDNAKLCKDWPSLYKEDGSTFVDRSDCTSYAAEGGVILTSTTTTSTTTTTTAPPPLPNQVVVDPPSSAAGAYAASGAAFGPTVSQPIAGLLVVVNDGTTSPTEGCSPLVGFPAGSIAIVDRGGCEFVIKVGNAQAAGAVAVVVANNVGGDPITMGGVDASITISSVMVSQADGAVIKVGLPATGTVQPAP
jgi:hypothetical protein